MKKTGTILASLLGLGLTTSMVIDNRTLGGDDPDVPHYLLNESMCARYARYAAKDLSNTTYIGANAWDLADANRLAAPINEDEDLEGLVDNGILVPKSSIVVFYNQKVGKLRHAALYMGKNERGEYVFAHQYHETQTDETLQEIENKGLIPKQVIAPK